MSLEETIERLEIEARAMMEVGAVEPAEQKFQMAKWLKELKRLRELRGGNYDD